MVFIDAAGDADDRTSGILIPVRCAKTGKGRYDVAAVCVRHLFCHIFRVLCRVNQTHFIAQPLNCGTGYEDGAFQRVGYFSVQSPGDCRDKSIFGKHRFVSGIHQKKAAGTICIFCFAWLETSLSEQCRLLVSCSTGDEDRTAKKRSIGSAVNIAGGADIREHTARNRKLAENLVIPGECIDIEKHGAGGIGIIRNVDGSLCQLPDQPSFYGAKKQVTVFGAYSCVWHVIKNPFDLGGRKISIDH